MSNIIQNFYEAFHNLDAETMVSFYHPDIEFEDPAFGKLNGERAKNMMHTFRLLHMAKEIASEGVINVHRKDRAFLLDVKKGKFEYEALVKLAEQRKLELEQLYAKSELPERPDLNKINTLLYTLRQKFYTQNLQNTL